MIEADRSDIIFEFHLAEGEADRNATLVRLIRAYPDLREDLLDQCLDRPHGAQGGHLSGAAVPTVDEVEAAGCWPGSASWRRDWPRRTTETRAIPINCAAAAAWAACCIDVV